MKIKKIEIKNIASIEDATIDFTAEPLKEADIFLITGVTGSGKTTILDAICLALYRTVPRLAHLSGSSLVNSDALTLSDPRNVMRLQTGEAYVKLQFEGNDGRDYEAEWAVQRGLRKKANAKLNNYVWSLSALEGEEKKLIIAGDKREAYTDVEQKIKEVVGLDFEQFCRTTMLAQGQFTKFLQSTEKEKSAILEKITGTGIYSKIGVTIYRIKADKEQAYNQQKGEKDAIKVLSEEERQNNEQELAQQLKDLEAKNQEQNDWIARIGWLKIHQDDCARLADASTRLEKAQKAIESEQHVQNKATSEAWQETLNIRHTLRRLSEEKQAQKQLEGEMEQLYERYKRCMSGWVALQGSIQQQQKEYATLDAKIESEKPLLEIYKQMEDIYSALTALHNKKDEREEKQKTLVQSEQQCGEILQKQKEQQRDYDQLAEQVKEQQRVLSEQVAKLEAIPHQQYRKQIDALRELVRYDADIKQYAQRVEEQTRELQRIDIEPATKELENLEQQLSEATKRREFCELSVKEAATMLRTHLHEHLGGEDCVCPVCKQRVDSLPEDAVLSNTVVQLQKECQELEQQKKQAEQKLNELRLKQTTLKSSIERDEKDWKFYQAKKQDILESLDEDLRAKWIAASDEQLSQEQERLNQQLEQYDEESKKRDTYQRSCNEILQEADKKLHVLNETNNQLARCEESYKMSVKTIEEIGDAMQELVEQLREQLKPLNVEEKDWMEQPRQFAWKLSEQSDAYYALLLKRENKLKEKEQTEQEHRDIQKIYQDIRSMRPLWGEVYGEKVTVLALQNEWMKLRADLDAFIRKEGEIRQSIQDLEREWEAFEEANKRYDIQGLKQLDELSQATYEQMAKEVQDCQTEHITAKALYEESLTQLKEHEQDAKLHPATAQEDDNAEVMTRRKDQLEEEKQTCMHRVSAIKLLLKQDDENKLLKSDTKLLNEMYKELERWKKLCSIFGGNDAQGSQMRKIAQCFILSKLLDAANYHLRRMSDRYRLLMIDGTLDMKLEDKHQYYATRSVHSISGGESFMVSLSLALALADFGQGMGVETLFIDEGFGTLSGEPLQNAINLLQSLHTKTHRQVGIISHREEIREHIPVQICVDMPSRSSASRITVVDVRG